MSERTIIVAGSLAQRPQRGGHAWVFLQYLLGFRRLGFDVCFLDRLEPEMCRDQAGRCVPVEHSTNLRYLDEVMRAFSPAIPYAVIVDGGTAVVGMGADDLRCRLDRASLLLDVMGYVAESELASTGAVRAFLDIDPGYGQMWQDLGLATMFGRHDAYVTIGERIGSDDCTIPTCGIDWMTTRPPVVLEEWPRQYGAGGSITTVASWRGPFGPVEHAGRTYGLRAHEFRRFMDLPLRSDANFELALDIDGADARDREALIERQWRLVDPHVVAGRVVDYRRYVQASRAEFMVAKGLYVASRGGWFSDRSVCYLASGRPVVVQDTGISELFAVADGVLTFSEPDEAADAILRLEADYEHHALSARHIAEQHFDSDTVLRSLLTRLGVGFE
jgi:hypothetical protein